MSKNKQFPDLIDGKKAGIFIAPDGKQYSIIGMTLMELQTISDEVEAEWLKMGYPMPKPPMQKLAPQFGDPNQFYLVPFTDETIDEATDYEKRLWDAYKSQEAEYNKLSAKRMLLAIVSRIVVEDKDLEVFLKERQQLTGCALTLPEDEFAVKKLYVEVNIIGARTESEMTSSIANILAHSLKAAGVIGDEEIDRIIGLFRNTGQESEPTITGTEDTSETQGAVGD